MDQQDAIGAELLERDVDDPAQHFIQIERSGERLENGGEKAVSLLRTPLLRPLVRMEGNRHRVPANIRC